MQQKQILRQLFERPSAVKSWSSDMATGLSRAEADYIARLLDWSGKLVLDVAGGAGRVSLAVARKGADVCTLDIATSMVRAAGDRANAAGVRMFPVQGDAETLPFKSDTFDVILCLEALWLFPHPQRAIAEMQRVVKPGGYVLIGTNNRFSITYLTTIPYGLYSRLRGRQSFYKAYVIDHPRRWLERAGLRVRKVHGLGLLPPGINVVLAPGYSGPPYPPALGRYVLHWEERHRLGDRWPGRFMKEILILAQKEDRAKL